MTHGNVRSSGKGQLIFFWHNRQFLGWDSRFETPAVAGMKAGGSGVITVRYIHYAPQDPLCCPSLGTVAVTYRWNGKRLTASGTEPHYAGSVRQVAVEFLH